jgi:hypothetical protein
MWRRANASRCSNSASDARGGGAVRISLSFMTPSYFAA